MSCTDPLATLTKEQDARNATLLHETKYCGPRFESKVLPFTLDLAKGTWAAEYDEALGALEKVGARTAIESLASLAAVNDIDHLGGALELIPPLLIFFGLLWMARAKRGQQ